MLYLLGVSVQYCEEYQFGYHVMDCPDNTTGVYKYENEYYFLQSNGTLLKRSEDGYAEIAAAIKDVRYYNGDLIMLGRNSSLFKYSKSGVEQI